MDIKKRRFLIVAVGLLAAIESLRVIFSVFPDREWLWGIAACLYLAAVGLSAWGMWRMKQWALKLSWFVALVSFGFGVYITHFRWTFWLFKDPTLKDRILSVTVQNPDGLFLIILSIFWLICFVRPKTNLA